MSETSQKFFWFPGGPVNGWAGGGPVFLKSAFFVFLVIFLQTWAVIDARNLPIFFWSPGGPGGVSKWVGSRGASFLKICILCNFGDIYWNLSWYKCQKPPKKYFGSPGGRVNGWAAGGQLFLKPAFFVILVIFLLTWAEIDARNLPKKFLDPQGGQGG